MHLEYTKSIHALETGLKAGRVLCLATDTLYGLIADATNDSAVSKILSLKMRNQNKGLPIFFTSKKQAEKFLDFNQNASVIASRFWPGALSIILPIKALINGGKEGGKKALSKFVYGNRDNNAKSASNLTPPITVAARIPDNILIRYLSKHTPLVATSANLSGRENITSYEELDQQLADQLKNETTVCNERILCYKAKNPAATDEAIERISQSTIISFSNATNPTNTICIHRLGHVPIKNICDTLT